MHAILTKHRRQLSWAILLLLLMCSVYISMPQFNISVNSVRMMADMVSATVADAPMQSFFVGFFVYLLVCSIPFPFVSIITILMGYLFGPVYGMLATSFASALGGCVLFLASKRFLRTEWIDSSIARFPALEVARQSQDFWVATSIRLFPGMPFFLPSIILSVTQISLFRFYLSTQLGLVLTLAIYINAGNSLAAIESLNDIFSPQLIIALALIALLPLLSKLVPMMRVK